MTAELLDCVDRERRGIRVPYILSTAEQGFVSDLVQTTREKRIAVYVGDGRNRWPAAHFPDVARFSRVIVERTGLICPLPERFVRRFTDRIYVFEIPLSLPTF